MKGARLRGKQHVPWYPRGNGGGDMPTPAPAAVARISSHTLTHPSTSVPAFRPPHTTP